MFLKALITVCCGILFGAAVTPPQPAAKGAVKVYKGQPIEYIIRWFAYFTVVSSAFLAFGATIAAASIPSSRLKPYLPILCPKGADTSWTLAATMSPRFIFGAVIVIFGGALRLWSFRVLGPLFTFEVVIHKDHRIIKSGPYAFIRHPAYLGMIALTVGVHLMQFGANGYVTVCDLIHSPAAVFVYMWWPGSVFVIVSMLVRCAAEDVQLEKHFGDEWHRYRTEVPYGLLPFVY
ncbi:hypothetical protein GY45DRAFT_1263722 [Cubamyces sp. BRFM 1775]|nr:hypothetical protein GY45DRAFT_1263722 [Cubamyces sp. BRFM 1775]